MPLIAMSAERLAEFSMVRRQLRDIAGIVERRPGVFVAGQTTVVEFFEQDGVAIARLAPHGHGSIEAYALDEATRRRALLDALRLRVKRLVDE